MKTIAFAAVIGATLGCLVAALVGADWNSGLAVADDKQRHALEGAALWAVLGAVLGALVGAGIGSFAKLSCSTTGRRH
jgi:hypothetical protein